MHISKRPVIAKIFAAAFILAAGLAGNSQVAGAAAGDPVADRILGQPNCTTNNCNTVDPEALNNPNAVAIDKTVSPNRVYVADTSNNRVLGYASISALVNGGPASLVIGQPDFFSTSVPGTSATTLSGPKAVAVDASGNLYVADTNANRVLKYNAPFASGKTAGQAASMVFGQGLSFTSNQCNFGTSSLPSQESMCNPAGVALDSSGDLFVADTGNNRVLAFRVPFNPATDADVVYGQGGSFMTGKCNLGAISPTAASLCNPNLLAVDGANNLYVADTNNNRVLKFVTPLTNTTATVVFGQNNNFTTNGCNQNSSPGSSTLCNPNGVAVDSVGDVFIGDTSNNRVLMFKPPIAVSPVASFVFGQAGSFTTTQCNAGSTPSNATLCGPRGVAPDGPAANLMIADTNNNRVLKWPYSNASGPGAVATVVLGQVNFSHNSPNTVDATALCAPAAVAIDKSVSPNRLWVVDTNNNRVLGYNSAAAFTTYQPANIVIGQADFASGSCNQSSFAPTARSLCNPNAAVVDNSGNLWVSDGGNNRVLKFPNPFTSGLTANEAATVVLGQGGSFTTATAVCPPFSSCPSMPPPAAGTATQGGMCLPSGLAFVPGTTPRLYVSDENNNRVLVFTSLVNGALPGLVLGQPNFTANYCNRNNTCGFVFPSAATMCGPDQIAADALGNLYVGDTDNSRVLEFNVPAANGAAATRVFGQLGNFTGSDCNLDAEMRTISADSLCDAEGVAADTSGTPDVYIADTQNNRVLWYKTPLTTNTTADLVVGQPSFFTSFCNFGSSAPSCKSLCQPLTPAVDSLGNLYVPDAGNNRVLEYDNPVPTPTPTPKPTSTPKPTPTAVPSPIAIGPVINYLSMPPTMPKTSYVMVGAGFAINGSGFTPGSVVNFFVATSHGPVNAGPLTPTATSSTQISVVVPASVSLGQGFVAVQVVNTDRGYASSNAATALLFAPSDSQMPTIKSINSAGLASTSLSPQFATDNVETVVQPGSVVTLGGSGFDAANGVAVDLFCACPGGKVGPFFVNPGAGLTSTAVSFFLPAAGAPNSPAPGPGSFVVSNAGSDRSYSLKSNAVSVPIGARISVSEVSQDGSTITVAGTGFSTLTVINFYNSQSGGVVNLGGLKTDGLPAIPLTLVSDTEFTFTVPAGAVPGASYVQAINPPFVPYTSSGSDPGGALTLK